MKKTKTEPNVEDLVDKLLNGDAAALAKAITLVESTHHTHLEKADFIIEKCLSQSSKSIRIGITGVPGVGKSTFIEAFGKLLITKGKKVAVLAIDPSSSLSKGSILGDKTRMNELSKDVNAFIRPSASGSSLGGVARKTRESIILCEAAGYDAILIETMGVGQSEIAVHDMVDFFLLLKLAGAGDELQGIKRGIIEMADGIVINKADGQNKKSAEAAKQEFARALHLFPPKKGNWMPKVMTCSALNSEGIQEIWTMIEKFVMQVTVNGFFEENRKLQNKKWFLQSIDEQLKNHFFQREKVKVEIEPMLKAIAANQVSPFHAAKQLLQIHLK